MADGKKADGSELAKLKIGKNIQIQPAAAPASVEQRKNVKKPKKKRRDKSDLGDDFVAPDGGWGWLVAISSGVTVLVTFATAQQFGIIFRDHMAKVGISNSELTTIINTQIAVSALTGLLNGPLFRRFTFRQVALAGSFLIFLGLFMAAFADTFLFYMFSFSLGYGFGRGLIVSASSLAVNTYFKEKRRTATSYQFGVAGLGPIILPYVATYLLQEIGVQGTVLMFAGLSLHTVACSLIYQPVMWHVEKKKKVDPEAQATMLDNEESEIVQSIDPDTPTLARANDGWFGSRTSLNSYRARLGSIDKSHGEVRARLGSWDKNKHEAALKVRELRRLNSADATNGKPRSFSLSHSIKEEDDEEEMKPITATDEKKQELMALQSKPKEVIEEDDEEERRMLPFYKKVIIFFDLDLLRDLTYVNLAMGLTLITFVEINFAILTPFILSDFGYQRHEIAIAMSMLGFCDLVIRFLIPLLTSKLPFSNKTFFIVGILGMCVGRIFLVMTNDFYCLVAIFAWLGLFKAARTVFALLVIPSYVPLKRLPAAAGLQLLMAGIFSLVVGPIIGLIRDNTNYKVTLHVLNGFNFVAIGCWLAEDFLRKNPKKHLDE